MKQFHYALITAAFAALLLSACGSADTDTAGSSGDNSLVVLNYGKYLDASAIKMFEQETGIKIKPEERAKAKRKAWELKVYARMSVLALAAMATARLVLLTIDIIQLRAGTVGGEICIPAYAAIFIYTGWKLKSWTAGTRKGKRECTTTNATAAGAAWTRGKFATASGKRTKRGA